MVSKTALIFALVATGNFSELLACINVVSIFFAGDKGCLRLHSHFRSSLQVPSPNTKRVFLLSTFFLLGKMVSKTPLCFALVVTGTFSEFLA